MSILKSGLKILPICLALIFAGCTKNKDSQTQKGPRQVNLAIWGNYLSPEMVQKFTEKTGIQLNISNYTSNEELLAKVQAGAAGIDVAVPSDYMVSIMAKLELLEPIDKAQVPNSKNLLTEVTQQSYDPGNQFSLPYSLATAGIAINRDLFKGTIKSWKDVFNNNEIKGKVSLLDDVREVTAAALKFHGFSVNTTKPAELKKAEETLLKMKSKVKMFNSDTIEALLKKEVAVAHAYSTDALQAAAQSNGTIEYILPEEGGTRSVDSLVLFKTAENKKEAYELMNFLLSTDANVSFVKSIWGAPVLKETRASLPDNVKNNKALFPTQSQISKFENIIDLGDNTRLYDELWTKVKTE
jgi:spermidine/putrescine transport system substrate-binding protein